MRGSIQKREGKRGAKWTAVVDLPRDQVTGKRRQKRITAKTRRETEHQVAEIIRSISSEQYADAGHLTVSQYLVRWHGSVAHSVRPSTHRRYGDLIRLHMVPIIGHVKLAKLAPLDIQHLYDNRLAAGLSSTTVSMIHNVLHRALRQALRWGLLMRNVTEMVDAPREAESEFATWDGEQVGQFLAVADSDDLSTLWRLAVLTGMRRGELLALKWEDVDLDRNVLAVRRTLSRGPGGTYSYGEPKTKQGRRSIALPLSVVESLKRHRVQQLEHWLSIGGPYTDEGLVFTTPVGRPLHPNTLAWRFKKLTELAGIPRIRFHDLRHTSATLMLGNGEHPKIVQERLGHSDISITLNRYSHVTMDMQRQAADRLDKLFELA